MTTTRILSPGTCSQAYYLEDGTSVRGTVAVDAEWSPCQCGHGVNTEVVVDGEYLLVCSTDLV